MMNLILAVMCSVCLSICMRISEKHINNQMAMFITNYLICLLFSLIFLSAENQVIDSIAILTGGITGVLYLISFLFFKANMKHNGLVLSSTFMKLGVLIPTFMAIFIFREIPGWTQILGIIFSISAIILINYEKESIGEGNKKSWLIFLLIFNGLADAMANVFDKMPHISTNDMYLVITFFSALLIAIFLCIYRKEKFTRQDVIFGLIIGIPNYFSARFLLKALQTIEAVVVYPVYSVAGIVLITLAGVLGFKESLSIKKCCALGFILIALVLLNL